MGIFCLVLHTHLPYVRRNGVWPSGEDFFHQAAAEAYLPLVGTFERLADAGVRDALTIGLTPTIAHQMQDPHMLSELGSFLARIELRAMRQVANYEGVFSREFKDLAAFYARFGREQQARLDAAPGGGIATALAAFEDAGLLEILGGPATHPYLPMITEPSLARAQMHLGAGEHVRLLGRRARGAWLPECAYRPGVGIEGLLTDAGFGHVVVDGPTMLRSAGPGSTFAPRRIGDSGVVAFARDLDVTYRVWSPTGGYPTGRWYRDFFHYDVEGGFKDWRVTSIRKPLERKRPYEPARAEAAARADAEDFAGLIATTLARAEAETGREAVAVAAYDTELFGHWWFEGPAFLEHLFTTLTEVPGVRARSLAGALAALPEPAPVELVEGSWGFRKDDRSWVSEETAAMWDDLHTVERETVRALGGATPATPARAEASAHMVREAMLLQSSDWPFMVLRGRNPDYARERFAAHRERWRHALDLARGRLPEDLIAREVDALRSIDNLLPSLRADEVIYSSDRS